MIFVFNHFAIYKSYQELIQNYFSLQGFTIAANGYEINSFPNIAACIQYRNHILFARTGN